MKNLTRIITLSILSIFTLPTYIYANDIATFNLTITGDGLRNSKGVVKSSLYNKEDSIPDEKFQNYFKTQIENIKANSSLTVFENIPKGKYAVSILHDENEDGKIDKGFILPITHL